MVFFDAPSLSLEAIAKLLGELLVTSHTLTDLAVTNSDFGLRGAGWLARALEENGAIRNLRLINCGIGDPEAVLLARSLYANRTLVHLCLEMNRICDEGVGAFMEAQGGGVLPAACAGLCQWNSLGPY